MQNPLGFHNAWGPQGGCVHAELSGCSTSYSLISALQLKMSSSLNERHVEAACIRGRLYEDGS